MLKQITQFDNDKTNVTVATPTCSCCSCCCCCCCLTTVASASTVLGQSINRQSKKSNVENKILVTTLGALLIPLYIALAFYVTLSVSFSIELMLALLVLPISMLFSIYKYVKFANPLLKTVKTFSLIILAVAVEFIAGAILILYAWPLYILFIILGFFLTQKIYSSKIKRQDEENNSATSTPLDPDNGS